MVKGMEKINFILAQPSEAKVIKELVNEMYGIAYETRSEEEIALAIESKNEIYILAKTSEVVGFCGASLNNTYYSDIITPDIAVIDYIYIKKQNRGFTLAYKLLTSLVNCLVEQGTKKAIMQVQTFNKQRFFHYALSDKNIIKNTLVENGNKSYFDQILLIENLNSLQHLTMKELMEKVIKYTKEE